MNRRIFPLLAALALAGAAGCTEDRFPVETQAICAPTDDCTFQSTCDAQYIGTYYVLLGQDILVFFQMGNTSPNNEDLATGRVNTNDAHIWQASIEFTGAMTGTYMPTIANQAVPAGSTAVIAAHLPTSFAAATGVTTATIHFKGYFDNGREFETGDFPLDVVISSSLGTCAGGQFCPSLIPVSTTRTQIPSVCL